jgi:hypothetical protein
VRDSGMIPAIRREPKPSPTESPLLLDIDPQPMEETLTARGGEARARTAFAVGGPARIADCVPHFMLDTGVI